MSLKKMTKEDLFGHTKNNSRYDLMEAVIICLGEEKNIRKGNALHGMLTTLLSDTLKPKEKEEILKEQYDFVTSIELEGGLERMCNLSERIEEKALQKGIELGIKQGIEQGMEQGIEQGEFLKLVSLVKKGFLPLEMALQDVGDENKEKFLEMF